MLNPPALCSGASFEWILGSLWYRNTTITTLISLGNVFSAAFSVVIILILFFGVTSRIPLTREIRERIVLRLSVVGGRLKHAQVARFLRTLGTLIAVGVPKAESFNTALESADSLVFSKALSRVGGEISGNTTIAPSLERSGVIPPAAIHIIETGEQAGALDAALIDAADASIPGASIRPWSFSERLLLLVILGIVVLLAGNMLASAIQAGSGSSRGGG
jgi:type II secretory pathway component PulF